MKNLLLSSLAVMALAFTSCDDDETTSPIITPSPSTGNGAMTTLEDGSIVLSGTFLNQTVDITNDQINILDRRVVIGEGATLNIEEGSIFKARLGTNTLASTLVIARGGKIFANGTAANPIIFTSQEDNIEVGQKAGTNLDQNDRGLWGGLLILGNAPSSLKGDVAQTQIEGIPASDISGLYGGNDPADNSGVINYISIRHGGAEIGEGNEINGLTLGGVGNGTEIDHVEVVANVDDGIEFFGGTVNASNLLVWAQGDDALDIDQAYSGTISNAVVVLGEASDHALEIDGPEGTLAGSFTIDGLTLIGNLQTEKGEYADYRSGATGATNNVFAKGFKDNSDVELDNNGVSQNFQDGTLTFADWEVVLPAAVSDVADIFAQKVGCVENCDDDNDANDIDEVAIVLNPSFKEAAAAFATAVTDGAETKGADESKLAWTYSNTKGGLNF